VDKYLLSRTKDRLISSWNSLYKNAKRCVFTYEIKDNHFEEKVRTFDHEYVLSIQYA
jgi:hypothetical protein